MSRLKNTAADVLHRVATFPISALLAVVLWLLFRIAAADTYFLTDGPRSGLVSVVVCIVYFFLFENRLDGRWYKLTRKDMWRVHSVNFVRYVVILVSVFVFRLLFANVIPPFDPLFGCIAGFIVGLMFVRRWHFYEQDDKKGGYIRGTRVVELQPSQSSSTTPQQGLSVNQSNRTSALPSVRWANRSYPPRDSEAQFGVIGAPGSGKSLMHKEAMRSVLPAITPESGLGALILDVKQDLISQLNAMNLQCPVQILNPLDRRSVPWNIAADLSEPGNSFQYASIFIASDVGRPGGNDDGFFLKAARTGVAGAIDALTLAAPGRWTLRDLIFLTTNAPYLRALLSSSPHTSPILETFDQESVKRGQRSLFGDIVATIAASMLPLKPIAGVWEHSETPPINFTAWAKTGGSVLVLGNRFTHKDSLMPINQVMFHRIANLLLARPECPGQWRTWVFIDELEEGGRFDNLGELMSNGRSKGVRAVLGFQDIPGLRLIYGKEAAEKLIGLCGFTSFLRLSCRETANWASERIGERELWEISSNTNESTTRGQASSTTSGSGTNTQIQNRKAVLSSELMHMDLSRNGVVHGYHLLASEKVVAHGYATFPLFPNVPDEDFQERTRREEFLPSPWSAKDWTRLGIKPPADDDPGPISSKEPLEDMPPFDFS